MTDFVSLDPPAFRARIYESVRGGIPSSSLGSGSRSAEKPIPALDRTDRQMLGLLAAYNKRIYLATQAVLAGDEKARLKHVEGARVLESAVLIERYMTPEQLARHVRNLRSLADEENNPKGLQCANGECGRGVRGGKDDPMIKGRCRRCHRYLAKHEQERPWELCQRDIERQLEKEAS